MKPTAGTLFSFLYLGFSLMGKTGTTGARYLSIARNLYYLLKPDLTEYYKHKKENS